MKIVLNPDYILRHDIERSYIVARDYVISGEKDWSSMIHPIQAMILSFFSYGNSYLKVINELSTFLEMHLSDVENLIKPFIQNEGVLVNTVYGKDFLFPKNLLIRYEGQYKGAQYSPEYFSYKKLDFETSRMLSGPLHLTFMTTTFCATDCIYCYCDNTNKLNMSFPMKRFEEIVNEAQKIKVAGIGLIGGEIFMNPKWKDILDILCKYEFYPDLISTKMPLSVQHISYLKNLESKTVIQISLDSICSDTLKKIWRVNSNYLNKVVTMFNILEKYNLQIKVATTLTKFNDSIDSLKLIYSFISKFKIVKSWDVGPAFFSLYKGSKGFDLYKTTTAQISQVEKYLTELNTNSPIEIDFDNSFSDKEYYCSEGGSSNFMGAECSANLNHLFILPDGKVTICEQLYWNPDFIVGNIRKQSIVEIWTSERARKFTTLSPTDFREESFCKKCKYFEDCHITNNKCWVEIIKAYGKDNWDFPDPRCKLAPTMLNDLTFN